MTITQYKKAIAKLLKAYKKSMMCLVKRDLKKEREKNEYNAR
jgi:hypothetical protein